MEFNSSVVSRVKNSGDSIQPVITSVASEGGKPGLNLCLSAKTIPQKSFHRASKGGVLSLWCSIAKNKHKDQYEGITGDSL